jgi:hypothetical protein
MLPSRAPRIARSQNRLFTQANFACYSCHRENYEKATEPNHVRAGFPTQCEQCHLPSQTSWNQASVNHGTFFPLQGVHATIACAACHKNNVYAGTSRDCYACHRTDYERTQNPNHLAAGFPITCDACHRFADTSFDQARFDHGSIFPLQGVHATQACAACHKNNVYAGTPRDCYGCHRADYERTQNPIASGRHAGHACSDCHPDRANFQVYSCFACHDRSGTDSNHRGVSGYSYNSQACYSCHPQGRT